MKPPEPKSPEPWQRVARATGAIFTAAIAAAAMLACLWWLHDLAKIGIPFGGHTAQLGPDYVWANRIALGLLVIASVTLAHALARVAQAVFARKS